MEKRDSKSMNEWVLHPSAQVPNARIWDHTTISGGCG
eukprot:CAMPEP_0170198682 /NCGR_PEP_ID=MMETSP0040_2-20121228/68916_1 /TAXON_ID=641309 /ORGANISM="Lotharella oceanica, Strain CCMP622" /LENGTH=36 /DNA_ID= /DNA_START= /DNA_END= /DNA_ORIENTATION=